jgi:acyl-CoA dehydrogenase
MNPGLVFLVLFALTFLLPPIRQRLYTSGVMKLMKRFNFIPRISETERTAIEAGTAWVEKEFFKGQPNLKTLLHQPIPRLTEAESRFLDNQVETLCSMIDDWKIWKNRDISPELWNYIRKEKFLGMIIPKEYGGLEFSATAHSEVIQKIASRSLTVAIYVMVPNSLGPAELLVHYGTDAQKKHFLPRLADGHEVPCFALTEPAAGSDAGSIQSHGILFRRDGELWIRLTWKKRYITLAKISTVLGLAFQLCDPEKLLGGEVELGITCALIPSNTPGVHLDHRHDPLGVPFYNCPTTGENVEVPASAIIGGIGQAGKGWQMLMQSLAAGRGISFPANTTGGAAIALQVAAAHAVVREQFGVPVGKFEGIQKPLAEVISGHYLLDTLRLYTLSALDQGLKPAIITAIAKYMSTEYSRKIVNHVMDILGGAGISMGPRNRIAPYYIAAPIGITVEGANILTRTLVIFGQGAFRAHPYAFAEIDALEKNDLPAFDRAFWAHGLHVAKNTLLAPLFSLTRGWLALPFDFSREGKYHRKLIWASTSFAWIADFAMIRLGGKLKFKESITGRLADLIANLYLVSAVLNRVHASKPEADEWAIARHCLDHLFAEIQVAFEELYQNLHLPFGAWARMNPFSRRPSDASTHHLANLVFENPRLLERQLGHAYRPGDPLDPLARLRKAAELHLCAMPALKKSRKKEKLTDEEVALIAEWQRVQAEAIQVDSFTEDEYHGHATASHHPEAGVPGSTPSLNTEMPLPPSEAGEAAGNRTSD